MRTYAKVQTRIWNDKKFRSMTDDGQLVFLFILTHPHQTSLGAFRATLDGLAAEKGWSLQRFTKGFGEALSKGMAKVDEKASLVWLPKHLKHNHPENPNVVVSWGQAYASLPESPLRAEIYAEAERVCQTLSEGYRESFRKGMPIHKHKPEPKPEPNPEQEQQQLSSAADAPAQATHAVPNELVGLSIYESDLKLCMELPQMLPTWKQSYPGISVIAEIRKAHAWELANPQRRKTPKGRMRFLNSWMDRAQNNGGSYKHQQPASSRIFEHSPEQQGKFDGR